MTNRTNCLERAGHILILCIWVEKRLVDLCILKDSPLLIEKINKNTDLPKVFLDLRSQCWRKGFKEIKTEFFEKFQPKQCWRDNLEAIYYWRNSIGHGHISLYRDYLLHVPDRDIKKMLEVLKPKEKSDPLASPTTLLVRFSDDKVFERMLALLEEMDAKYLKYEAEQMGLNYEKIR